MPFFFFQNIKNTPMCVQVKVRYTEYTYIYSFCDYSKKCFFLDFCTLLKRGQRQNTCALFNRNALRLYEFPSSIAVTGVLVWSSPTLVNTKRPPRKESVFVSQMYIYFYYYVETSIKKNVYIFRDTCNMMIYNTKLFIP